MPDTCGACVVELLLQISNVMQDEKLDFRQSPTFADCFPSSEKCYKDVDHEGAKLRVSKCRQQQSAHFFLKKEVVC